MSSAEKKRIDVFVSSTSLDLADHRKAIRQVLIERQMHPVMMEDFPAISSDAIDACRAKVLPCDLFLGIYANRYGYCPNKGDISITEMEYDWAKEEKMEHLIFVIDEKFSPDNHPLITAADTLGSSDYSVEQKKKMDAFLSRISNEIVWKTFTTPEDLALKVSRSVEEWEKSEKHTKLTHPNWFNIPRVIVVLLNLIIIAAITFVLLRANSLGTIGTLFTIVGGVISIIPFWARSFQRLGLPLKHYRIVFLAIQAVLLLGILMIGSIIITLEKRGKFEDALQAPNFSQAQAMINDSSRLGANVDQMLVNRLKAAIENSFDDTINRTAELIVSRGQVDSDLIQLLQNEIDTAFANLQEERLAKLVPILAILDPIAATRIANEWNAIAVDAIAVVPADITKARLYLNAASRIDANENTTRTAREKGITLYNLGSVMELDDSLDDSLDQAISFYRAALGKDASNYEVSYALSSLILVEHEANANYENLPPLSDAIDVATNGRSHLPDGCILTKNQLLTTSENEDWYCFLLLTVEAGAHLLNDDVPSIIQPLLDRAILIAETNDYFGRNYFTAEAFYWYARLTEPETHQAILCGILLDYDSSNNRHERWAAYARGQLGEVRCAPR